MSPASCSCAPWEAVPRWSSKLPASSSVIRGHLESHLANGSSFSLLSNKNKNLQWLSVYLISDQSVLLMGPQICTKSAPPTSLAICPPHTALMLDEPSYSHPAPVFACEGTFGYSRSHMFLPCMGEPTLLPRCPIFGASLSLSGLIPYSSYQH